MDHDAANHQECNNQSMRIEFSTEIYSPMLNDFKYQQEWFGTSASWRYFYKIANDFD